MKILDYLIRFKHDTKTATDAAKADVESVSVTVKKESGEADKTFKGFFSSLKKQSRELLQLIPGGGLVARIFGTLASGPIGVAVAGFAAVGMYVKNLIDYNSELKRKIDEANESWEKLSRSISKSISVAVTVEGIDDTIASIEQQLTDAMDERFKIWKEVSGQGFWTSVWNSSSRQEKKDKYSELNKLVERLDARANEAKVRKNEIVYNDEMKKAEKDVKDRNVIIAEREASSNKEMYSRKSIEELMGMRSASVEALSSTSGAPITEESNAKMRSLFKTIEQLDEAIKEVRDANNAQADEYWAKQDELHSGWSSFKSKIEEERIAALSPEQQLAGRRDQYRRVVSAGLNTADPEKRLELFNRAFELRAIMRPLIESLASKASGADEESGGGMGGGVGRVRRGPLGLGRLSGNRAGYRFGRVLSSQFDGSGVGGGGSQPGKRPMEDIGEEQLRVLKSIEAKTGFGKGG